MANYHFCPRHFAQCYNLQINLNHACTCITGPNTFYTPKLNANTMVNGIVLILEALYKGLIQKWQKVYIATLIKFTLCNFVYLEPWTKPFAANKVHKYQAIGTNSQQALS